MNKQTIIENEFVTLWYYPDENILSHRFHKKTIFGDSLRSTFDKGLEILSANKACKWLSDDRMNVALTIDDTNWLLFDWSNRCLKAGWKYWALVQPELELGRMNLERFTLEYAQRGLTVKTFKEPEEAMKWLLSI